MATVLMPALLASFGSSSVLLGIIEGLADGTASFAKLFSGFYSDRLERRKPLAFVGYLFTACGMASFGLAHTSWQVLVGRTLGWLGRGVRSPVRKVLLVEATTPSTVGRAMGFERGLDSAGAFMGPLLALFLVHQVGLQRTFFCTFAPGLLAVLAIAVLVRERSHTPAPARSFKLTLGALPRDFRRFVGAVTIAGLGDFSNTLLILWATEALRPTFGLVRAAERAALLYVGYNIVYMLSCFVVGHLADRINKRSLLAVGYAMATLPALGLLWPSASLQKFAFVFAASGLYMGVWETVESAVAATLLPAEVRGTGYGVLDTANGIGDVVSSMLVGVLWAFSPTLAMGWVIATSLLGATLLLRLPAATA